MLVIKPMMVTLPFELLGKSAVIMPKVCADVASPVAIAFDTVGTCPVAPEI